MCVPGNRECRAKIKKATPLAAADAKLSVSIPPTDDESRDFGLGHQPPFVPPDDTHDIEVSIYHLSNAPAFLWPRAVRDFVI